MLISEKIETTSPMETKKHSILVVDDHQLFREGLSQMINREADLQVSAEAADDTSALEALNTCKPDMAIIDISLAGRCRDQCSSYPSQTIHRRHL